MSEPPLTDREIRSLRGLLEDDPYLRKLRGMIDDHEYQLAARRHWRLMFQDVRGIAAILGAGTLLILQVAELYVIIHPH